MTRARRKAFGDPTDEFDFRRPLLVNCDDR